MTGRLVAQRPNAIDCLTLESLALAAEAHPQLIEQYVAYGLVEPLGSGPQEHEFDMRAVARVRMIGRLRRDLGINLPGIAVVLDLLDRINSMQRELAQLRHNSSETQYR
jgi:chaperone modulatory protein CbpM